MGGLQFDLGLASKASSLHATFAVDSRKPPRFFSRMVFFDPGRVGRPVNQVRS
jgi:hypothetical protein